MKTVEIKHRSTTSKSGTASLVKARSLVDVVVVEYDDGRVQVSSGDIWYVEKSGGKYDYETVVKFDKNQKQFA